MTLYLLSFSLSCLKQACLKNLLEMNPDVQGEAFPEDPHEKVNRDISFFEKFDIVIVTGLCRQELIKLSKHLWNKNIPLLVRSQKSSWWMLKEFPTLRYAGGCLILASSRLPDHMDSSGTPDSNDKRIQ